MSRRLSAWRLLVNNRLGLIGLMVFSAAVMLALVTPWLPLPLIWRWENRWLH